jgi:beta-aspartyl-peptidase (threonine type)
VTSGSAGAGLSFIIGTHNAGEFLEVGASKVMEEAPHVLLVGEGAEQFARSMGCEDGELGSDESRNVYAALVADAFEHEGIDESQAWVVEYAGSQNLRDWYRHLSDDLHGTVNVLARDAGGNIASAVSTSGTALKFPGRLGDSPIVGAGNYCDGRYGEPACTGRGELGIRNSTARTVIHALELGLSVVDAATHAMRDIHEPDTFGGMNCLVMDAAGNRVSATTDTDRENVHWYMNTEMETAERRIGLNIGKES